MRSTKSTKKRQRKFRYGKNRTDAKRKALKRKTEQQSLCEQIASHWDKKKSAKQNMTSMGLAYDANKVVKIPKTAQNFPNQHHSCAMEVDEISLANVQKIPNISSQKTTKTNAAKSNQKSAVIGDNDDCSESDVKMAKKRGKNKGRGRKLKDQAKLLADDKDEIGKLAEKSSKVLIGEKSQNQAAKSQEIPGSNKNNNNNINTNKSTEKAIIKELSDAMDVTSVGATQNQQKKPGEQFNTKTFSIPVAKAKTEAVQALEKAANEEEQMRQKRARVYKLLPRDVAFCTGMLETYGDNYEAMARDRKNIFQDTANQIARKIRIFKESPEYRAYEEAKTKNGPVSG